MPRLLVFIMALFGTAQLTLIAHADDNPAAKGLQSPLSPIYKCAAILDSVNRLNCFDTNVAALRLAEQNEEVVAIDVNTAKKLKREAFGFNLPSLRKIGLPKIGPDEKIDSVVLGVKSIRTQGYRYVVTLENGQVWHEIGDHAKSIPKGELMATIKPKSFGSFMLTLENASSRTRSMRAKRVK